MRNLANTETGRAASARAGHSPMLRALVIVCAGLPLVALNSAQLRNAPQQGAPDGMTTLAPQERAGSCAMGLEPSLAGQRQAQERLRLLVAMQPAFLPLGVVLLPQMRATGPSSPAQRPDLRLP